MTSQLVNLLKHKRRSIVERQNCNGLWEREAIERDISEKEFAESNSAIQRRESKGAQDAILESNSCV